MFFLHIAVYILYCIIIYNWLPWTYFLSSCIFIYILLKYILICQFNKIAKRSTRINYKELYNMVHHGDIINITWYSSPVSLLSHHFNYGIAHCGLIIIKNNKKFILHSHPKNYPILNKDTIIDTKKDGFGDTWVFVIEPLLDFLQTNSHTLYHIYKPPSNVKPLLIKQHHKKINPILNGFIYYCTIPIGDILMDNGIIPKSSKYARYRTDELLDLLEQKNYTITSVHC